jgi:phosphoribosyl-AMP cyclohydrolase
VIAQQADTGKVVMFAWMNRESLALSQASGYAVYWSRSRQKLWRKGEESGNRQKIVSICCSKTVANSVKTWLILTL